MARRNNKMNMSYPGTYQIYEMDEWNPEEFGAKGQAYIRIARNLEGEIQFGTVCGEIRAELDMYKGIERLEFTWEGIEDQFPSHGAGWLARVNDEKIEGYIRIHNGESSGFYASRILQTVPMVK